ncbi:MULTISPECIES: hypothetical protein [unclassified Streptomyces]|uniref:hypothetical protein n=1 Tax=unclassified Streptomyces TaxID=2593676 RepID=UPI002250A224|nr:MULTISPECIES: hypothetical protein [unclassified Streptomyces]MCX5103857.1 hypothetical protein [Streptomyces sp. NBC_00439]WSC32002.1 hypothetical protein OG902_37800 [Streptomyces sp. NBC_01768]WSX06035.1 hypothetical protein OG355_39375 [Streptomyces sp. NBC_00987]
MPHRTGMGTQHSYGLVTYLVRVAVGAEQQVPAPPFPNAGNHGELVPQSGGHHDPAGAEHRTTLQTDEEAGLDLIHMALAPATP